MDVSGSTAAGAGSIFERLRAARTMEMRPAETRQPTLVELMAFQQVGRIDLQALLEQYMSRLASASTDDEAMGPDGDADAESLAPDGSSSSGGDSGNSGGLLGELVDLFG